MKVVLATLTHLQTISNRRQKAIEVCQIILLNLMFEHIDTIM